MTGIIGEYGGTGRRAESNMMEELERGLSRTESGPRLSHVNIVTRLLGRRATESRTKQRQKPSIFVASPQSQVLRLEL